MGMLDWFGLRESAPDPEVKRLRAELETTNYRLEEAALHGSSVPGGPRVGADRSGLRT